MRGGGGEYMFTTATGELIFYDDGTYSSALSCTMRRWKWCPEVGEIQFALGTTATAVGSIVKSGVTIWHSFPEDVQEEYRSWLLGQLLPTTSPTSRTAGP